jgi:hypothetical protein
LSRGESDQGQDGNRLISAKTEYESEGQAHHPIGDQLSAAERTFMSSKKYLRGFENDSGMTILRIGSMNLMLMDHSLLLNFAHLFGGGVLLWKRM